MSDAASDMYREERRERKERDLYMKMMKDEFPRRKRVLALLLKYLGCKSATNRKRFCNACKNLTDFDAETVLLKLLEKDESTWASLLYAISFQASSNNLKILSPFKTQTIDFESDRFGSRNLNLEKRVDGVLYHRKVSFELLFKLPSKVKNHEWRYLEIV